MKLTKLLTLTLGLTISLHLYAIDHKGITQPKLSNDRFTLIEDGEPTSILISANEIEGVVMATENLQKDFYAVAGKQPSLVKRPNSKQMIIVGSLESDYIQQIIARGKIDAK